MIKVVMEAAGDGFIYLPDCPDCGEEMIPFDEDCFVCWDCDDDSINYNLEVK